nr:DUF3160 domain-containing protein [uncultured Caproiciproducens sp.]
MLFKHTIALILCCSILLTASACGTAGNPAKIADAASSRTESKKSSKAAENAENSLIPMNSSVSKNVSVPYTPTQCKKSVKAYQVNHDLSNITNLKQFGSFSAGEKKFLSQNAFVVAPSTEEQLFYLYEKNSYLEIPSFITADSVLQVYHIFYDYSLRNLESTSLIQSVEELTDSMLKKSIQIYSGVKNSAVKSAALKNIAYFGTAALGLKKTLPADIPAEAKTLAEKEYSLIQAQSGFASSAIFPFQLDYSQFKPRGHYTRSDDFKRYFIAMAWYGQAPFPLYKDKSQHVRNVEQTLQALLVTYALFMKKDGTQDITNWEKIYEPTSFYVGSSDDLTIYDYQNLLQGVYGGQPNLEQLDDSSQLNVLYKEAEKLPEPKIVAKYTDVTTPVGKQLRLMGQRYLPDSEMLQELVEPIQRPIPSGLDVMGILGSDRAYAIQLSKKENQWEGYPGQFAKVKEQFSKLSENKWRSNLYYGWLWTLKGLTQPYGNGYPSFMTNQAWTDKSLNTSLGSWSELRHDTILYGKQSGAEKGGGEEPKVLGYVEPVVEVYDRLLWLTEYSRQNLVARGLLTGDDNTGIKASVEYFENLLKFLRDCSVKELKGQTLTDDEYERIYDYGENMEEMTASLASDGLRWFEIQSETDKNMALIADFHTVAPNRYDNGGYLEAGVGPAHEIYVVVPINGKLYLTRGAVFSYYEFESGSRLTDEEWQTMLKSSKTPAQPSWTSSFISSGKGEIPKPQDPYNSN